MGIFIRKRGYFIIFVPNMSIYLPFDCEKILE